MNRVDLYRSIKSPVAPFIRKRWNHVPFITGANLAQRYLRIWSNNNHNLHVNGEAEVLRRLGPLGLDVLFDVGCHKGAWTDQALAHHPTARIEAFEADPSLVVALKARYENEPRVTINGLGLADITGTQLLYVNEDARDISSMVKEHDSDREGTPVEVSRGDDFVTSHNIERVDFLKIDAEGFDWNILQGFDSLLGERLTAIQFEYNEWNITGRRLLADFYELLGDHGYRIGKIHPNGVAFKDYSARDENWVGPACLAVHRSATDVIAATEVD